MNKDEIFLGQVPIAVGSRVEIKSLTMDQLEKIVTGIHTNWKEVGGPDAEIVNVGREKTEALYSILKKNYPFYNSAKFTKIFAKDNHVVDFLKNSYGDYAITFGAKPNFQDINKITILKIDNFSAGQQLGLVYDLSNKNHPLVKSAAQYAGSNEWQQIVATHGNLKPNKELSSTYN